MPIGYNANMNQPINPTPQSVQPLFPQPTGNVYSINSTLEVANVPVGAGMSVALCLPENIMFIKTMQNGNPLFYPYKVIPFTQEEQTAPAQEQSSDNNISEQLKLYNSKLEELEKQVKKLQPKGGFDI